MKSLQLRRNETPYSDLETAINALNDAMLDDNVKVCDGEPLVAKYNDGTEVKSLIGLVTIKDGVKSVTILRDSKIYWGEF